MDTDAHISEGGFIASSDAMKEIDDFVSKVAPYPTPILLTGETGVGKGKLAEIIHSRSGRENFVPVNCSAVPENLLESTFLGHKKGAFTGAVKDSIGLFERSNHGTLFLDEISVMSSALQPKLLKFIDEKKFMRVGDWQERSSDVRLLSATNEKMKSIVGKEFREDLYYRLNTLHIDIPPLRNRPEDIIPTAKMFIEYFSAIFNKEARFSRESFEVLKGYHWPGNTRELKNLIEKTMILSDGDITPKEIQFKTEHPIRNISSLGDASVNDLIQEITNRLSGMGNTLVKLERLVIAKALQESQGIQARAACLLGVEKRVMNHKVHKHNLGHLCAFGKIVGRG